VIYYEAATRGLITSPEDELAVAAADAFEKSWRIRNPDSVAVIYILLNEDRCVPRTRKHLVLVTHLKGELITP